MPACNPDAAFDALCIVSRVGASVGGAYRTEVYLFSYLSCVLYIYRQNPVATWGYDFSVTRNGLPFSAPLDHAIDVLMSGALLNEHNGKLEISESGSAELEILQSLGQNSRRVEYIDGATASLLALPMGVLRGALQQQPDLARGRKIGKTRRLFAGDHEDLYDELERLSRAIGVEFSDLMIPAVAWLAYLSRLTQE